MIEKNELRRLWSEAFRDSAEYTDMFMEKILPQANVLAEEWDGKLASVLLTMPYRFVMQGTESGMTYLTGAATRRNHRGRGMMRGLVGRVLRESAERGDMLCSLIPASEWLYAYFTRLGFSSVFLADRQHFTSRHPFNVEHDYAEVVDVESDMVYERFRELERGRGDGVCHSRDDFRNVLSDLRLKKDGTFVAVGREGDEVAGMAWACDGGNGELVVFDLLGVDDDARTGAMRALRSRFPNRPMVLLARVDEKKTRRKLHRRGMARIVNVEQCLECVAKANREWRSVIRVYDRLLEHNSHTYIISDGEVRIDDGWSETPNLDVSVEVLAALVFSAPHVGEIMGLPSRRTHISLMVR